MSCLIEDSFREQISIFYYAHLRRVAYELFAQGLKDTTVAANLLLTKSKAQHWRELFDQGELLKSDIDQSAIYLTLPFAQASDQYHWENFAYDVKRAAKVFFDMGLRCRAIAVYLGVPLNTVHAWQRLYKDNEFKIEPPIKLPPLELTEEKFTIINSRNQKCYSYEVRAIAKQCFDKGMNTNEVARYLDIPKDTVYRWTCLYKKGRFYINEEEKKDWGKSSSARAPNFVFSFSERSEAKACFLRGMTISETARYLEISHSTALKWFSQFKENRFYVNAEEKKRFAKTIKSKRYSLEDKLAAKALFEKGVTSIEVAKTLNMYHGTVKRWHQKYEEGTFCIEEDRKRAYLTKLQEDARASNGKLVKRSYTEETRLAAKACFDQGLGCLETAMTLGIPRGTVKDWKRLYEDGHFKLKKKNKKTWI